MQQIGLDATLTGVPDFTGGIDKMNRAVDSFAKNGKDAGSGFGAGFGEIVTGALRQIGTLAVDALMKAGRAVAGFVKDSVGLAGDFQSGMLEFQSVAGKEIDTSGLEEFHDLFLQLGKDLPVSTSDVQKAAIEMVKGGIDPATIAAGGLRQNIQFAAAAMGGDLVKAAEISSKIMGGWAGVGATAAEKADFLTHATDMLAKAANASSTDVDGLSRGIFNAQGIARTAGVSFDDLTTTLAALAPRFASSSEAGNSLKNMIVRLQPTTDPATNAMKALGLYTDEAGSAFYDAAGNFIGFQQASELLKQSLVGLTKEQQASALQTIFGNDAMGSASALAELGAAGYQEMADALLNANGVMDSAALKQQGFNTSLDNAKGSVEALQITLGEKLLPILGDVLDNYIAPFVNSLTDLAAAVFGDDEAFNKLAPDMQALVTVIDAVVQGFNENGLLGALEQLVPGMSGVVDSFTKTGGAGDALGGALDQLNGVWDLALKTVTDVGNGYMAIAESVLPIIQNLWTAHGTEISAFVKTTYDSVIKIITLALQLYDAIVPPILQAIAGFFKDHASEIEKVLTGLGQALGAIVTGFMDTVAGVFQLGLDLIHGDWQKAWDDILAIGKAQITAIQGFIGGFLDMIAGLFDTSMADILQTWEDNWNMAVNIVSNIDWGQVGADVIAGIVSGIQDNAGKLMSTLKDLAGDALQAAKDALGISSPSKEFAAIGGFAIDGMIQGFADGWPALRDQLASLADDLVGEMEGIGDRVNSAIADSFGATASIDRQIAKNLDRFKDVLPQYQQYTQGALKEAQQQAMEFADPAQGAKFFKMRSDQILEYAKLQKDLSEAETQEDKDRINAQMVLINAAQMAEIAQMQATKDALSPMLDIAAAIKAMLDSIGAVTRDDPRAALVDQLQALWAQLQTPVSTTRTPYNPNVPGSVTNSTTLNMPIYTNQSAGVLQSSMAIAGAALI